MSGRARALEREGERGKVVEQPQQGYINKHMKEQTDTRKPMLHKEQPPLTGREQLLTPLHSKHERTEQHASKSLNSVPAAPASSGSGRSLNKSNNNTMDERTLQPGQENDAGKSRDELVKELDLIRAELLLQLRSSRSGSSSRVVGAAQFRGKEATAQAPSECAYCDRMRLQYKRLKHGKEDAETRANSLEVRVANATTRIESLDSQLSSANASIASYQSRVEKLCADKQQLEAANDSLSAQLCSEWQAQSQPHLIDTSVQTDEELAPPATLYARHQSSENATRLSTYSLSTDSAQALHDHNVDSPAQVANAALTSESQGPTLWERDQSDAETGLFNEKQGLKDRGHQVNPNDEQEYTREFVDRDVQVEQPELDRSLHSSSYLQQQIDSLERERQVLMQSMEAKRAKLEQALYDMHAHKSRAADMNTELAKVCSERDDALRQLEDTWSQTAAFSGQTAKPTYKPAQPDKPTGMTNLQETNASLRKELEMLKEVREGELEEQEKERAKHKSDMDRKEEEVHAAHDSLKAVKAKLEKEAQEKHKLQETVDELKIQASNAKRDAAKARKEYDGLLHEKDDTVKRTKSLEQQLADANVAKEEADRKLESVEQVARKQVERAVSVCILAPTVKVGGLQDRIQGTPSQEEVRNCLLKDVIPQFVQVFVPTNVATGSPSDEWVEATVNSLSRAIEKRMSDVLYRHRGTHESTLHSGK